MKNFWRALFLLVNLFFTMAGVGWADLRPDFDEQWKTFRTQYPYHVQVVGLSAPAADGHRLLLISEPPPHVTLDGVRSLDPRLSDTSEKEHPIGVDGWVKDLRVDLPPMTQADLDELMDSLSNYLFFTSYKAIVLALPVRPRTNQNYPLDIKVSAADLNDALFTAASVPQKETSIFVLMLLIGLSMVCGLLLYAIYLRRWVDSMRHPFRLRMISFLCATGLALLLCLSYRFWPSTTSADAERSFIPVNGGEPVTPEQILEQNRSGVFLSVQPGLVLWSFQRNAPLSEHRAEIRQFALDSDLILGAVRKGDCVLVVARERSVPVDVLPPLRTETILQLASVKTDELAQSYERNHVLAGKLPSTAGVDQGKDWAPIYLSDELIDTEYGSLLNITDQLLKSWSMAGHVRYDRFDYPDPAEFPLGMPLSDFAHTMNLTFNWNTKGAGYVTENGAYGIYALNRTGALPIDYLSKENNQLREAEDKAYDKFAGSNNPHLVRVVQYAALYQIFRNFQVTSETPAMNHGTKISPVLKSESNRVVNWLLPLNTDKLRMLAVLSQISEPKGEKVADTFLQLAALKEALLDLRRQMGKPGLDQLTDLLANRNAFLRESFEKQEQPSMDLLAIFEQIQELSQVLQDLMPLDIRSVEQKYRQEQGETGHRGWIRTASVVQSSGQQNIIGGHNLSARTVVFEPSAGVAANHVNLKPDPVTGQQIIEYNPEDFSKIGDLARPSARDQKSPEEIKKILEERMPKAVQLHQPLRRLINFDGGQGKIGGRGLLPDQAPELATDIGWKPSGRAVREREASLIKAASVSSAPAVIVTRLPEGGYSITHGLNKSGVYARNLPEATDVARSVVENYTTNGTPGVTVYLAGFEPRPGRSFSKTLELRLNSTDREKVSVVVEGQAFEPKEIERIFSQDYDFPNATVERVSEAIREPEGDWSVTADIKVPARKSGIRSLWMQIKVRFKDLTAPVREVVPAIRTAIREWQASLADLSERRSILEVTRSLRKRLRAVDPGISVETSFHEEGSEGRDLYADHSDRPVNGRAYQPA